MKYFKGKRHKCFSMHVCLYTHISTILTLQPTGRRHPICHFLSQFSAQHCQVYLLPCLNQEKK